MERSFIQAWKDLPQKDIQAWIEGVYHNVQKVITLNGGNEYKEGRETKRSYKGLRRKGLLSPHAYYNAQRGADEAEDAVKDDDDVEE